MSEKIIEEVMGLISDWSEKDFLWGSSQIDAQSEMATSADFFNEKRYGEEAKSAKEAIRAKLREVLERKPLTDVDVQLEAHNEDDFDWNDLGHKKTWHEGFAAGFRAAECTHKIGAE